MKKWKRYSTLTLASTLLFAGLPYQSVSAAATVQNVAVNLASKQATQSVKAFISSKVNTSSSEIVRVIVQFNGQPTAVGKYAAQNGNKSFVTESSKSSIQAQQASFIQTAKSQGINLQVHYQFNTVLNGMEISVPANMIPQLAQIPGVKSVYENRTYYALPDQNLQPLGSNSDKFDINPIQQIGADQAWARGITGRGVKVGVIDTGTDYEHPDLKDAFKGGHDSFYNTDDPYDEAPVSAADDPLHAGGFDGTYHGTHVSGTIVGRGVNPTSDIVQKGIAYDADLYVYKVLGRNPKTGESTGSTAQVIDGIERAVRDGMDVVNLSLGSDDDHDPNSPDSIALNNAVLAGVTVCVANGNAALNGHYYESMGTPAASQLSISVGAATSPGHLYAATTTSSFDSNKSYAMNAMAWQTNHENFKDILGTDPLNAVYVGIGDNGNYANVDAQGKVVFVSRGIISFANKILNAKAHGAKAVIIFNGDVQYDLNGNPIVDQNGIAIPNLSASIPGRDDNISSTGYLGDDLSFIPTFDMKGTEGRALAAQVLANPNTPLKFTFGDQYPTTILPGDQMANFSSRGPNSDDNYGIKPDITGPGVNILSTYPEYGKSNPNASYDKAYARLSGTSMATPHIAGLSLLLKQAHPDWTPFDIRAALANTADEISDENGIQYDVYSQGAGRANVAKALDTPAVLQTVDQLTLPDKNMNMQNVVDYGDNASFGLMAPGSSAKTETLHIKNTSSGNVTYTASVKMHPNV
ncbi:MAG: S8 family serine peptidase, partial [Tumebacillaceae bacterium]